MSNIFLILITFFKKILFQLTYWSIDGIMFTPNDYHPVFEYESHCSCRALVFLLQNPKMIVCYYKFHTTKTWMKRESRCTFIVQRVFYFILHTILRSSSSLISEASLNVTSASLPISS